ncbi:MAG TPA: GtrA family protein [Defluviicoccus sp.]|nr:GtrA family protein [Defluviicoccus sp.]
MVARFLRFTGVGAIATAAHYAVLVTLVQAGAAGAVAASATGCLVGAVVSYVLNYRFTFFSARRHVIAVPIFFLFAGLSLALNTLLMAGLTDGIGLHYLPAQVLVTGVLLVWNFFAHQRWTFRERGARHRLSDRPVA